MEKKILKKLLAIMMIVMLMATDFVVLGSNLISYAVGLDNTTNNENIEFSAYFKDEGGKRLSSVEKSIEADDLKLYVEIKVKNEGYFNGSIELQNSNFNLKNEKVSSDISKIEGNKVTLNQINAGSAVEIELGIEPIISEQIALDKLKASSIVKLTGNYMENTYKGIDIESEKSVNLNLVVDEENTSAELTTEIVTNKIYSINGENKRVVQLLVESKIANNNYPIKQTALKTEVPQLSDKAAEEVKVLSLGTEATNGLKENILADQWNNKDGNVQITINNEPNENNEISWKKDVYDRFVLTFVYAEDVDASNIQIKTTSEIELYNRKSKFTAEHTTQVENKELNNIIVSETNAQTLDIYKGQLYANVKATEKKEIPFNTTTKIEVRSTNIVDTINVIEKADIFVTDSEELNANTKYLTTTINKEEMIDLLGEDGFVEIKFGETVNKITKDSEINESGNIIINYNENVHELEITTSKPVNAGALEIVHEKAIMSNTYTTEQIRAIKSLKLQNVITALLGEEKVVENTTEKNKEIKETFSQVELTVNKENLSTMTTNKDVIIGVKLNTADTKYDLYKNPTIKIQLPKSVEDIRINSFDKLYADEFEIERAVYNKVNKTIEISLKGEQLTYAESEATELYLQINFDITLSKAQPSKTDKITLEFTNENAIQNVLKRTVLPTGTVEKEIKIVSPTGLVAINSIESYDIESIVGTSEDKQLAAVDKKTAGGSDAQFKVSLVNNTSTTVNNIKILGKFPTDGEFTRGEETITNNMTTTLKSAITAENCTIYYSSNINATADLDDTENGWNQKLAEVQNPKAYLIEIASMDAETNFEATYTVQLPTKLEYDLTSYSGYQVLYTEETDTTVQKVQSTLVGLTTGEGIKIETIVEATVGNDVIKDGDIIKNGEVIKYKVTTKNNGTQKLENIVVEAGVPAGTVVVVPEEDYVYTGSSYYEEKTDITKISEKITSLEAGQTHITEYEVRVNMDTASGTEISNKATATCGEFLLESNELKNTISESQIRVTIKRTLDENTQLLPKMGMRYLMFIENLSDEPVNNLKIKLLPEGVKILSMKNEDGTITDTENEILVEEIPANGYIYFHVYGSIPAEELTQIMITVNVTDSNGNIYRSNKNIQKIAQTGAEITLETPNNGEYVKTGDVITYNIQVKNTGEIDSNMLISDNISEYLDIEELYVNEELKMQTTNIDDIDTFVNKISNDLAYNIIVKVGETANVKIIARVKEIKEQFDVKTISNFAKVSISWVEKDVSSEVTHLIKGTITEDTKNTISGVAWLDENQNGQKDVGEKVIENINAKLFDITTNTIAKDENGNNAETITNVDGKYTFTGISDGEYIVLFEYDTTQYELTTYMKEGVQENQNSNVVLKTININGEEKVCAVTDTIRVIDNISNINIGLKEILIYDMELDKYITRIVVQNEDGTKAEDYSESTFQKVEIHSKKLKDSVIILEYTIRVTNKGEIAGYVTNIKDYLPSGLQFSSELNADWYLSGEDLHTKSLANERIEPGESREIKLILTKTMTENNTGLINNRAEIEESYNEYGKLDIDSTVNNAANNEDDLGAADVIIGISTGGRIFAYTILLILNTVLISVAIYLIFIKNRSRR